MPLAAENFHWPGAKGCEWDDLLCPIPGAQVLQEFSTHMPSFPFPQLLFLQFDSLAFWLHRCQLFSYKTEAHAAEDPKRHELIEPKRTPGQPVTAGLSDLFMRTL